MAALTDTHRAFLQLVMVRHCVHVAGCEAFCVEIVLCWAVWVFAQSKHAVEAETEAADLMAVCKERFGYAGRSTVAHLVRDINDHLEDLRMKIDAVTSDCDGLKYYVFANKVRLRCAQAATSAPLPCIS